jgi:hypothetical protein
MAADIGILSASSNVNFMFSWIALSMSLAIWGPFSSSSARARPGGGSVSQSRARKGLAIIPTVGLGPPRFVAKEFG